MATIHFNLTKNKSFELQVELFNYFSAGNIFECNFNWYIKCDHAGPRFTLILYKILYLHIMIYDHRHYNHTDNTYETTSTCVYDRKYEE